jgi:hypothetical protein
MKILTGSFGSLINVQALRFILSLKYEVDEDTLNEDWSKEEKDQKRSKRNLEGSSTSSSFDEFARPAREATKRHAMALKIQDERENEESGQVFYDLLIFLALSLL